MPTEWIMALGVLLVAGAILCFVVRRYEKREKPWQVNAAEKADKARRIDDDTDRKQPDIPVWRDKPKPRISASDVDPTSGLDPDFNWDGKDK